MALKITFSTDLKDFEKTFNEHFKEMTYEIKSDRNFDLFSIGFKIGPEDEFHIKTESGFCEVKIYFNEKPSDIQFLNKVKEILNKIERYPNRSDIHKR